MTQAREKEGEKTRGAGILAREAKPEARGGESWAGQEVRAARRDGDGVVGEWRTSGRDAEE